MVSCIDTSKINYEELWDGWNNGPSNYSDFRFKKLVIHDTTLRDGEQMPGVVFSVDEKVELAKLFYDFGCDLIELMPCIGERERRVVERLVLEGLGDKITPATLLRKEAVDLAKNLGLNRVSLFSSVSDIHLEKKLYLSREENLKKSFEYVEYAREKGLSVDFAGEDSSRADLGYLISFINKIGPNIDYFLACDTLGILSPNQTFKFIELLKRETDVKIGLHIHNDFGIATANTLMGIEAGADLFSGTFNGIGERSGNTPLEEVIVALKYQNGKILNVKYESLGKICDIVEKYSGVKLHKHKSICGENSFSHESGLHVDGVIKHLNNYENFYPEEIGRNRRFLFGKSSGRAGLRYLFGDRFSESDYERMLIELKFVSQREKRAFTAEEVMEMYG